MAVLKKRRRKIVRNGKVFWWCVKPNDDTYCRLLFAIETGLMTESGNTLLSIVSDDKNFIVSYQLNQNDAGSKIKYPFIITEGKEFKGLNKLGHGLERFIVPKWEDTPVTPFLVAQIIDWCFTVEDVIAVNWKGEILKSPLDTPLPENPEREGTQWE